MALERPRSVEPLKPSWVTQLMCTYLCPYTILRLCEGLGYCAVMDKNNLGVRMRPCPISRMT